MSAEGPRPSFNPEKFAVEVVNKLPAKPEDQSMGEFVVGSLASIPNRRQNLMPAVRHLHRQSIPGMTEQPLPREFGATMAKIRGIGGKVDEAEDPAVARLQREHEEMKKDSYYKELFTELKGLVGDGVEGVAALKDEWQKIPLEQPNKEQSWYEQRVQKIGGMVAKFNTLERKGRRNMDVGEYTSFWHAIDESSSIARQVASSIVEDLPHPNVIARVIPSLLDAEEVKQKVEWRSSWKITTLKNQFISAACDLRYAPELSQMADSKDPLVRKILDEFGRTDLDWHMKNIGNVEKNMNMVERTFTYVFGQSPVLRERFRQAALVYVFGERKAEK